jgi:glycosyltransferase involved in cell wall biosynthesis
MPRVCFVTPELHPVTPGGAGVFVRSATQRLLEQGHEVLLLLAMPEPSYREFLAREHVRLPDPARCRAYLAADLAPRWELGVERALADSIHLADALDALLARERPDLVEFVDFAGPAWASLSRHTPHRPPIAVRLHGPLQIIDQHAASRFVDRERSAMHALERQALARADVVLAPSRAYAEDVTARGLPIAMDRVRISTPPVTPLPVTLAPAARRDTLLFLGRLMPAKGVDRFIAAGVTLLRERPDLRLELIGPDDHDSPAGTSFAEHLRSLVPHELLGRVCFAGALSHEEIGERLARVLFAVFPNRTESFCYALHELLAARVPVLAGSIPAFTAALRHEQHALLYSGRTDDLLAAMRRLATDAVLRERLSNAPPLDLDPLGDAYVHPPARPGPRTAPTAGLPDAVVVVLCPAGADPAPTLRALRGQSRAPARTVVLRGVPRSSEPLFFLGQLWSVTDENGLPLSPSSIHTHDALAILNAGDEPDPAWLGRCAETLADPEVAFAGVWSRSGEAVRPLTLDLFPERRPFDHGPGLTRVLHRTPPATLLGDLLDPDLASLGEIGLLWSNLGPCMTGVVLQEPLLSVPGAPAEPADPTRLKYLLARYAAPLAPRLAQYLGQVYDRSLATDPGAHPEPSVAHRIQLAQELGGSLLAKMAWKKAVRRIMSP